MDAPAKPDRIIAKIPDTNEFTTTVFHSLKRNNTTANFTPTLITAIVLQFEPVYTSGNVK